MSPGLKISANLERQPRRYDLEKTRRLLDARKSLNYKCLIPGTRRLVWRHGFHYGRNQDREHAIEEGKVLPIDIEGGLIAADASPVIHLLSSARLCT